MYNNKTIIVSGSSDIGSAISKKISLNNKIISTYNNSFPKFKRDNITFLKLNIENIDEIDDFIKNKVLNNWDNLIILPATQLPIGLPDEVDPKKWVNSININFTNQIYLLLKRQLISRRFDFKFRSKGVLCPPIPHPPIIF